MIPERPNAVLPRQGRIAGIDYGTVRIGVAITDPSQAMASPLQTYTRRGPRLDEQYFVRLAVDESLTGFVVGLPVHTSGLESAKSIEARKFGVWLGQITSLPVVYFDERYTSAMAEDLLMGAGLTSKKRKARMDKLAAQILLSAWLDSSRSSESTLPIDDRP